MARKRRSILRLFFGNVWSLVCCVAAATCGVLAVRVVLQLSPFEDTADSTERMVIAAPLLFGSLAGLYGMFAAISLVLNRRAVSRYRRRLRSAHERTHHLEALRTKDRARLDELSMLREVATFVNQESDFSIIAGQVLQLIHGLLEPDECTLFLREQEDGELKAFAEYSDGKVRTGRKVQTRSIPDFSVSTFERHSMVCRVHGQELQAIVPLKVEDQVLGVLFLAFPTDRRPPQEQTAEFNRKRRTALLETMHHISLALKTKHLHTKAVVDSLTQLYSRSHFDDQLQAAMELSARTGESLSLVVIDIDHFKRINDTHGHATGDVILARLAGRISRSLRKYDSAYRYGGEEIVVLLPRTRLKEAVTIAERLRSTVESQRFRAASGGLVSATVSLGVAQYRPGDDPQGLFERADQRLYRAKRNGRNQVMPEAA